MLSRLVGYTYCTANFPLGELDLKRSALLQLGVDESDGSDVARYRTGDSARTSSGLLQWAVRVCEDNVTTGDPS